ncbi:hypothetical protein [Streptomyces hyaluromycini]|uniref:hypothetical protein n=1 Tax=Streptomyces hyaluromycini TaxID=1377993 RepID=UPI000B5C73F9|nr:hypothetical protein [Streptomyces hyaluromycini]
MTEPDAPAALCATGLGFRYRRRGGWALRDCEFTVPGGRIAGIGAAALVLAAVIAAYCRSGMLDALRSGLFDHCATGPLYCTRSGTGQLLLLEWTHWTRLLVPPHTYVSAGIIPKAPMGEKWSTGDYGLITASGRHDSVFNCPFPSGSQLKECMTAHGYVVRFYEADPAGDYWTFQWTDTAVLGGLAVLLTVVTVLLLRRRV